MHVYSHRERSRRADFTADRRSDPCAVSGRSAEGGSMPAVGPAARQGAGGQREHGRSCVRTVGCRGADRDAAWRRNVCVAATGFDRRRGRIEAAPRPVRARIPGGRSARAAGGTDAAGAARMLTAAVADAREQISREHRSETRHDRTSDRDRATRQELWVSEGAPECFAEHSGRADAGTPGTQRRGKDDNDPHSDGGATG